MCKGARSVRAVTAILAALQEGIRDLHEGMPTRIDKNAVQIAQGGQEFCPDRADKDTKVLNVDDDGNYVMRGGDHPILAQEQQKRNGRDGSRRPHEEANEP